jgi:hypothetical protein
MLPNRRLVNSEHSSSNQVRLNSREQKQLKEIEDYNSRLSSKKSSRGTRFNQSLGPVSKESKESYGIKATRQAGIAQMQVRQNSYKV